MCQYIMIVGYEDHSATAMHGTALTVSQVSIVGERAAQVQHGGGDPAAAAARPACPATSAIRSCWVAHHLFCSRTPSSAATCFRESPTTSSCSWYMNIRTQSIRSIAPMTTVLLSDWPCTHCPKQRNNGMHAGFRGQNIEGSQRWH